MFTLLYKNDTAIATLKTDTFGDGTLKMEALNLADYPGLKTICWAYDNDTELFTLYCLCKSLREQDENLEIDLFLPYIPNARQDREVSGRLFTLKYFADFLNSLNFQHVFVCDPHSPISGDLIARMKLIPRGLSPVIALNLTNKLKKEKRKVQWMYPDAGAANKYLYTDNDIVGVKHRNEEGRIDSYIFNGLKEKTDTVIIIDDICSYGGTFVHAATKLREQGVKYVYLAVTHCENNIIKGDALDVLDGVYTTDSICTLETTNDMSEQERNRMEKLHIEKCWRVWRTKC